MATPTVYTPKKLAEPLQLTTGTITLYTVPASTTTKITSLKMVNVGPAPVAIGIYAIKTGDTASSAGTNQLYIGFSVPADGVPYELLNSGDNEFFLNASDYIQGTAAVGTSITAWVCGVEMA